METDRPSLLLLLLVIASCERSGKSLDHSPARASASSAASAPSSAVALSSEAPTLAGADRLLKAEEPRVLDCYAASAHNVDAQGAIAFSIGLDATGMVASVGVTRTGSLPPAVASCVRALLVDMTFDPPAGGAATVNGRFTFAPGGPPK